MMVGGYSDWFSTTSLVPVDVIHQITAGDISYQKRIRLSQIFRLGLRSWASNEVWPKAQIL